MMNGDHDDSTTYPNESKHLAINDLQIIDFSRESLKNLIEQPNSIHHHTINDQQQSTVQHTSNLIDLNTARQQSNGCLNQLTDLISSTESTKLGADLTDRCVRQASSADLSTASLSDPGTIDVDKENRLNNQPDNRRFLTKDIDIFDFEHLNRHQKLVSLTDDRDKLNNKYRNLNNFTSNSFKLPFDSKLEPAVIQSNSDNREHSSCSLDLAFDDPLNKQQNSKFNNLGYQEQASAEPTSLANTNLSANTLRTNCCVHNTSSSSNNEEIEPLLNRSTNCNLCKNQNRLQTPNSKMEVEWNAYHNQFPEDEHFNGVIKEAERSIEDGNYPIRISQGSSGSYFVRDRNNVSVFYLEF